MHECLDEIRRLANVGNPRRYVNMDNDDNDANCEGSADLSGKSESSASELDAEMATHKASKAVATNRLSKWIRSWL